MRPLRRLNGKGISWGFYHPAQAAPPTFGCSAALGSHENRSLTAAGGHPPDFAHHPRTVPLKETFAHFVRTEVQIRAVFGNNGNQSTGRDSLRRATFDFRSSFAANQDFAPLRLSQESGPSRSIAPRRRSKARALPADVARPHCDKLLVVRRTPGFRELLDRNENPRLGIGMARKRDASAFRDGRGRLSRAGSRFFIDK